MEVSLSLIEQYALPWLVRFCIALAIFVVGRIAARSLSAIVTRLMRKSQLDETLVRFLSNMLYALLLVAVILAAIDGLGINITSLLAIVGAAGLAVGLALKDSLSNFAAGIMLVVFRPFKTGDFITAGGSSGVVDEIGMFHTIMHTMDNQRIIVPNSAIINGTIVNANALPQRRIDLVIGIGYGDDIGKAKSLISTVLSRDGRILIDPEPAVAVAELAASSVNINVQPWVATEDYWTVRAELLEKIKTTLDEHGITIPFPQQDVHMHTVRATPASGKE